MASTKLDVPALEQWLWDAACEIRGPLDAPKFKDYILPLIFLKRLSDVFDDEVAALADDFGGEDAARQLVGADHSLVRFFIPESARWSTVARKTAGLGEHLTEEGRHGKVKLALAGWYQGARAVRETGLFDDTKEFVSIVRKLYGRV